MYFFTLFEVSLGNTKAKVECVCFFIYITQITTLENGNHETWMGHPFFSHKMGLKPQIFEFSFGIKMNVDWVCFSIYLYHINHPHPPLLSNSKPEFDFCISFHPKRGPLKSRRDHYVLQRLYPSNIQFLKILHQCNKLKLHFHLVCVHNGWYKYQALSNFTMPGRFTLPIK